MFIVGTKNYKMSKTTMTLSNETSKNGTVSLLKKKYLKVRATQVAGETGKGIFYPLI